VFKSTENTRQIFDSAGRLFKKFGIKSITMDDISAELGMSKKTLYQHVLDKAELVEKVVQNNFMDIRTKVKALFNEDMDTILQFIRFNKLIVESLKIYSSAEEYDLHKYYCNLYMQIRTQYFDLFKEYTDRNITEGKKNGIYRSDINTDVITKLHVSRIEQAPHSEIFSLEEYTSPGFTREMCLANLKGIVSEKGQALLEKHMNELNDKIK
jgi:AcrR family transcriptional regulator